MTQPPVPQMPPTFAEAVPRLDVETVGLAALDLLRLRLEAADAPEAALPVTAPLAGTEVLIKFVYDAGDARIPVSLEQLESWGIDGRTLATTVFGPIPDKVASADMQRAGKGVFTLSDPHTPAWALVVAPDFARARLKGAPVILPASRHRAYVTGADDLDGLATVAQDAAQLVGQDELVTAHPLVLGGNGWEPFDWPTPAARGGLFGRSQAPGAVEPIGSRLVRSYAAHLYALQADLLRPAGGEHVAKADLVQTPDGRTLLVSTLTEGTVTLLPEVDEVLLPRLDGTMQGPAPLSALIQDPARQASEVPTRYPRRWRVTG